MGDPALDESLDESMRGGGIGVLALAVRFRGSAASEDRPTARRDLGEGVLLREFFETEASGDLAKLFLDFDGGDLEDLRLDRLLSRLCDRRETYAESESRRLLKLCVLEPVNDSFERLSLSLTDGI